MKDGPRAVVLVGNPVAPYSRALRIARTLNGLGYAVEIACVAGPGLPAAEDGEGYVLRRYVPSSRWPGRWPRGRTNARGRTEEAPLDTHGPAGSAGRASRIVDRVARTAAAVRRWLWWPHTVRGWWRTLARELAPADLYHACGSLTIAPALAARRRAPFGPSGRRAVVIYDAIDDVFESNNVLDMPRPIRAWHARRETAWAQAADAIVTVNEPLAERLGARWSRQITAVPNYPEPRSPQPEADPGPDLIRAGLGIPTATRIVLFQGRLGPRLGLDAAAEGVLLVRDAALVLLGFGRGFERERAMDTEPRFAGRHFTIPARHPDELLAWTASADVALIPLPPVSVNQRLSSPNKFWEALAAGTPVVVPAGLTYIADLVRTDDLGVVARSESAEDLATALHTVLEAGPAATAARRARIAALAHERFSWPVAAERYRAVVTGIRVPETR